jgi:hypothetical protein
VIAPGSELTPTDTVEEPKPATVKVVTLQSAVDNGSSTAVPRPPASKHARVPTAKKAAAPKKKAAAKSTTKKATSAVKAAKPLATKAKATPAKAKQTAAAAKSSSESAAKHSDAADHDETADHVTADVTDKKHTSDHDGDSDIDSNANDANADSSDNDNDVDVDDEEVSTNVTTSSSGGKKAVKTVQLKAPDSSKGKATKAKAKPKGGDIKVTDSNIITVITSITCSDTNTLAIGYMHCIR